MKLAFVDVHFLVLRYRYSSLERRQLEIFRREKVFLQIQAIFQAISQSKNRKRSALRSLRDKPDVEKSHPRH
jgi:hypothetical protein